jgi:Ca-activated chloride channel family protein
MPALLVALILLVTTTPPLESWTTRAVVVRGTVKDSAGKAIAGAHVSASLSQNAAKLSAADGSYLLQVTISDTATTLTVHVRALGYKAVTNTVPAIGDTVTVDFVLAQTATRLEEIVVTAAPAEVQKRTVSNSVMRLHAAVGGAAPDRFDTEEYGRIEDNRFLSVASAPLSTFSADVDRASYTNVRRFITTGTLPPKDAVRIEEMINYFSYAYPEPKEAHPVTITTDVAAAPWNPTHRIVRIGLQTKRIQTAKLPPSNLVFLIDVSGSMGEPNKLPLVKQAFRLLVNELREQDRVAIVVYAGAAGLVLPSTSAADKQVILEAIEQLEAGGSTAGGAGIELAYDVAKRNFRRDGNNRVILATDGDFNVGTSNTGDLVRYVERRREEGSALTILGFGMGNIKDNRLEQLADKGNGNYAYIDDLLEARKVFVQEMGATLLTVAKDVKLQVEFNPATVQAYRLIGYENRMLQNEDFTDDKKDAGDMGAGHSMTALYEIVPVGVTLDVKVGTTEPLRYQASRQERAVGRGPTAESRELLFVNVRYKQPADTVSRLMQHPVRDAVIAAGDDLRFTLAVAGYGMLLRDSEFKGKLTYDDVLALARGAAGEDRYRRDFVSLVESSRRIASGVAKR